MARLVKGDLVVVTAGNYKGKKGKVQRLIADRVVVEGVNIVKKHRKQSPQSAGGIVSSEAPIHISNVMLVDPTTGKPSRIHSKIEGGEKVRVAKSGARIASSAS